MDSNGNLVLEKYSFGMGDRFAHQANAQLRACMQIVAQGINVTPVWNKSYREHAIVGSAPASVRVAAEAAIHELKWTGAFHIDADHIRPDTVDSFVESSDYYTLDVADAIGQVAPGENLTAFADRHSELIGTTEIPGIAEPFEASRPDIERIAGKYLKAVQEASCLYRKIESAKGKGKFITEVSMDETDSPQTPLELLIILAAIADEGIPAQTIAPKFTGRFNKGVDYVGDVAQFEKEFNEDLAVIAYAITKYALPQNLKLSVHSGSDKFSIYEPIRQALARTGAGIHVKTAGTTWLEEIIGLAESGGAGLEMAKEIYDESLDHIDELCAPYATVIDIDRSQLPSKQVVSNWTAEQFANSVRHNRKCAGYNLHLRQLLHVGYKVAAKMGPRYTSMLKACEPAVARNVTENLFDRHLKPLFLG
jgi:hypothetical protein